jgi:hypothetical protein
MTVDELLARESIRHTLASYNIAGDRLRVDDFAAVFTEDGILESEGVPEKDAFRNAGRDEIRAWMTRWGRGSKDANPVHQSTFIRHHLSTCQIEFPGPGTARARTYWVAYTDIGPDHCGCYLDAFRKVGDRWLIAHRKVRMDWSAPESLFTSVVPKLRR